MIVNNKNQLNEQAEVWFNQQVPEAQIAFNISYRAQQNIKRYQKNLVVQIDHQEWCFAMAFNYLGNLIIAGCNNYIKVWGFDEERLIEQTILKYHTADITCLVISKFCNWFASGSDDNTIRGWKLNLDWEMTPPQEYHLSSVQCMTLNNEEDELLSGSYDKSINVWKVNCMRNELTYDYTLQNKHYGGIYGMSLNMSQNCLVTSSADKSIILWIKNNKKWEYLNHIQTNYEGYRICFISDTQFIWQPRNVGQSYIYSISQDQIDSEKQVIQLNQTNQDSYLFPTIYHQRSQIIIQKHNNYVYIIDEKQLKIKNFQIDCKHQEIYGTLSQDGNNLLLWSYADKSLKIYRIN